MKTKLRYIWIFGLVASFIFVSSSFAFAGKTIQVLHGGGALETQEIVEVLLKDFQQKNPELKIEFQRGVGAKFWDKFKVMLAAKTLPWIFRSDDDWVGEYFARNQFYDLTDLTERDLNKGDYFEESWKAFMYKGRVFGIPQNGAVVALYYNKNLFDEVGLPYPAGTNYTQDQFLSACKALTQDKDHDGRIDQYGFGIRTQWLYPQTWIWRNGGTLYNFYRTESLITQPEAVEALKFYTDLRHVHKVTPMAAVEREESSSLLFKAGRLGMWEAGIWENFTYNQIMEAGKFQIGVTHVPAGKMGPLTRSTWDAWSMVHYVPEDKVEDCWKVIKFLCGLEGQEKLATLNVYFPALKEAAYTEVYDSPATSFDEGIFLEALEKYSHISELVMRGAEMDHIWTKNIDGLFLGTKTAEQAAQDIKYELDELLEREKEWRPYATW